MVMSCLNCNEIFEEKVEKLTIPEDESYNNEYFEFYLVKQVIFCPNCKQSYLKKYKIKRVLCQRDTYDILDLSRLDKFLENRFFLKNLLHVIKSSQSKWVRTKTIENAAAISESLQINLWQLYDIGLIEIKCIPINNDWSSNEWNSEFSTKEFIKIIEERKANIFSICLSDLSIEFFSYNNSILTKNFSEKKNKMIEIITNTKIEIFNSSDPRLMYLKKIILIISTDLKNDRNLINNKFLSLISIDNYFSTIKFLINLFEIVKNEKICFTSDLFQNTDDSEDKSSLYRTNAKKILKYQLILFNTFRTPTFGDKNESKVIEIFQLIRTIEIDLRNIIFVVLSDKKWSMASDLWDVFPNDVKKGNAIKTLLEIAKKFPDDVQIKNLINSKYNDISLFLKEFLKESYLSDLGKMVCSQSLNTQFFGNYFPNSNNFEIHFEKFKELRNEISHAGAPSDSMINKGLLSAYLLVNAIVKFQNDNSNMRKIF